MNFTLKSLTSIICALSMVVVPFTSFAADTNEVPEEEHAYGYIPDDPEWVASVPEYEVPNATTQDKMTIEEYEKAFFGDYYITDKEAADFALAGYPGASMDNPEYISKPRVYFNIGEASEEKLSLLKSHFPKNCYFASCNNNNQMIVDLYYIDCPEELYPNVLKYEGMNNNIIMANIKSLYALTQIAKECDSSTVELCYDWNPGDYGRSLHADVNGDLKINAKDILAIKRFVVGIDYRIAFCNTDPTKDNKFDARDILQIKKYVVSIDDYTDYIIYPGEGGIYYNPIKGHFN